MENLSLITVYIAGVLASFTPCVYPLIPIIVSFIAAQAEISVRKKIFLTLIFVLGSAIVYSLLGFIASLTGSIFGLSKNSFWANFVVGFACLVFALSILGFFSIDIKIANLVNPKFFKGYFGSFILGATSGLVFSPCSTPLLGAILTFVSTKQNILYGMLLLFVFALGLSTTVIISGIFGGFITKLPKSGKWNLIIEKIFGGLLLIIGLYYLAKSISLIYLKL